MKNLIGHKKQRVINFAICLSLFITIISVDMFMEGYPSYTISTGVIIASGLWMLLFCRVISLEVIVFTIIFLPSLSPFYAWNIAEVRLFSLAARHLQYNIALVDKSVYLYSIAAVAYVVMATLKEPMKYTTRQKYKSIKINYLTETFLLFVASLTIISAYLLESGPTILTASYVDILNSRIQSTPLVVFATTSFGGLWSIIFIFGRHHKKIFWVTTGIVLCWLFLHSRRVEVFGIFMVLILWGQFKINTKSIFVIVLLFISIQQIVGLVRSSPLLTTTDIFEQRQTYTTMAELPGGANNVFLAGLHLVNQKDNGRLTKKQTYTMLEWPRSLIPNQIWHFIGLPSVQTEHDLIFNKLGLVYIGGMPLIAAFYLNGGILLVLLFGLLHGYMSKRVGYVLDDFRHHVNAGGTWPLFTASVFVIYQFRYHWYNPHTLFRAIEFSLIILWLVNVFIKNKTMQLSGINKLRTTRKAVVNLGKH